MKSTKNFWKPLRVLLLMLVAVGTIAGCGSSRDQYVITGTAAPGMTPQVNLANATLNYVRNSGPVALDAFATFNDDDANLNGGALIVETTNTDITIATLLGAPSIGMVDGASTNQKLIINLDASATPAAIQAFLRAVTIETDATAAFANAPVTVTVIDSFGNTGTDTRNVSIVPTPGPTVDLADTVLDYNRGSAALVLDGAALVTGDDANLNGGTLVVQASTPDIKINAPATAIGTVVGNGTDTLTVTLNATATIANVETFLRTVTIETLAVAAMTNETVTVTLTDNVVGSTPGTDVRTINIRGNTADDITVGPAAGDDFTTIQAAINAVAALADGAGSTITVADGDYTAEGVLVISADSDLADLTIKGNNAGVSAGTVPGTALLNSEVVAFDVDNKVVIDGFAIEGNGAASGILARSGASNSVFENNNFTTSAVFPAFDAFRAIETVAGAAPNALTIVNNHFEGWATGTYIQGTFSPTNPPLPVRTAGHVISNNVFVNNNVHASNDAVESSSYLSNEFGASVTNEAISFLQSGTGIVINNNDFVSTNQLNFFDVGGVHANVNVDAQSNYWGQATGPLAGQNNPLGGTGTFDTSGFLAAPSF